MLIPFLSFQLLGEEAEGVRLDEEEVLDGVGRGREVLREAEARVVSKSTNPYCISLKINSFPSHSVSGRMFKGPIGILSGAVVVPRDIMNCLVSFDCPLFPF